MSEGKYTKLGTVSQVLMGTGQKVMRRPMGGPAPGSRRDPVPVVDYSTIERKIRKFIEEMPGDADVHIEVSKDLWR